MHIAEIRAFVTTARHGTINGAAETLQYSQSGVSRQLRALESHLGLQLFCRAGGRLTQRAHERSHSLRVLHVSRGPAPPTKLRRRCAVLRRPTVRRIPLTESLDRPR